MEHLTLEQYDEIKNTIRNIIKDYDLKSVELKNDSMKNIEAYELLKSDNEFLGIDFKLVDSSFGTTIARTIREEQEKELGLI